MTSADLGFGDVRKLLQQTQAALGNLHASLSEEQRQSLEAVPFRFLEWTMQRIQHLVFFIEDPEQRPPAIEAVALSARLFVEALWTLRWIGNHPERAKEYAMAGFRDLATVYEAAIPQTESKFPEIAAAAGEELKALETAAAKHGADFKQIKRWPIGSGLIEKKLRGDATAGWEETDENDWRVVYRLSVYLHPTPGFVMAADPRSPAYPAFVQTVADCAARIASDIAEHLQASYQ